MALELRGFAVVDAVVGLTSPSSGQVLVDGTPVERVRADGGLLPHLSVRANIGWGRRVGEGLRADQVRGRIRGIASAFGLLDVLELHPNDLPPGRRLRVGLARALLRSPVAVALEERGDRPSRAGQLPQRELLDGVASLVVTDDADRLAGFADVVVEPSASGEVG